MFVYYPCQSGWTTDNPNVGTGNPFIILSLEIIFHADCIQKVSPQCEASCGSVTAMILRMFSHTLGIETSCSEFVDALLVLAC